MALRALLTVLAMRAVHAQLLRYSLTERLVGPDFFQSWNFYAGEDPTHGTVQFVTEAEAWNDKLLYASAAGVYMGVDNTTNLGGEGGRKSVRIESKNSYNSGLFVLTLDHVPTACGAWPAFWMFGDDAQHSWPRWGEYDILEAIHQQGYATTTLHTRSSCDQREVNNGIDFLGQGWASGSLGTNKAKNCWVKAPQEYNNQGCGQKLPQGSFGPDFNKNRGGTFVAEWDREGRKFMRTWFFPRGEEPIDLVASTPQPDMWGTPNSFFTLNERWCTADHFKNMRMVFDTTFCGDYAGPSFQSMCPWLKTSCEEHVRNNPSAFSEAFWNIKKLDVYQKVDAATLAAAAPVVVSDSPDTTVSLPQAQGSKSPSGILAFFFLACLCGAFAYMYYTNSFNVKNLVNGYGARLQQLWQDWRQDDESEEESPKKSGKGNSPRALRRNGDGSLTPESSMKTGNVNFGMDEEAGPRVSPAHSLQRPVMTSVRSGVRGASSTPSTLSQGGAVGRVATGGSFQKVASGSRSPQGSIRMQPLRSDARPGSPTVVYSQQFGPASRQPSREISGALPQPGGSRANSGSLPMPVSHQGSLNSRPAYPMQAVNSQSLPPTIHYMQAAPSGR